VTDAANAPSQPASALPPDNLKREVRIADADGPNMRHIAVPFGDTYTILVTGDESGGRYSLIDMHIAADAGPPQHRHDFDESFTLLEGELEFTVRGQAHVVRAGSTITVPSNAPHFFRNKSARRRALSAFAYHPVSKNSLWRSEFRSAVVLHRSRRKPKKRWRSFTDESAQ
jgi:quercetin dioxygenase-like cupin family protein